MKLGLIAMGLLLAASAVAQQKLGVVNAETPEGALLQQIGQEEDAAKKLTLLEKFAAEHAKHESIGWVYAQLQATHLKANQFDQALAAGEKLAALDPNDLEAAHNNLKAAEAKKDPDLVKKWAGLTSQIAIKVSQSPKPSNEEEEELWKHRVDFSKQLNTYTEYSLYAIAVQTQDARKRLGLAEALRQRNPQSEYTAKMGGVEFDAYRMLQDNEKALTTAERVLAIDQSNPDMLVFVANQYMEKKKEPAKVIEYAAKAVEVLNAQTKPEGVSEADFTARKNVLGGLANFIAGSSYYNQKKLKEANESLRTALPMVAANDQLKAATLFYLGLTANDMKNLPDSLAFNQQCAAIKSPFQAKAAANAKVLRSQGVTTGPAPKKK